MVNNMILITSGEGGIDKDSTTVLLWYNSIPIVGVM